ncbi:MAG: fibronectin type III domain-containing protein [Patescibacteria group bacterium]|nr:fibronectin type III domain-containing protein [Patescibacteria group bacterium]
MKRIQQIWLLCLTVIFLLLAQPTMATLTPTFSWDAPTTGDAPIGYKLLYDNESGGGADEIYDSEIDTCDLDTSFTLPAVLDPEQDYYFIVVAFNFDGDSVFSNELHVPTWNNDADSFLDYEEIHLYGTDKYLDDTDNDGINDDDEIDFWITHGSTWSTDIDGDGYINILDDDSDGDGIVDGSDSEPAQASTTPQLDDWDSEPYNSGGPLAVPVLGYWDSDDQMDIGVFRTDKKKLYIKYASQGFDGDWHDIFQYSINLGSSYDIFVLHRRNERSLFVIKTNADRYFHIDDAQNGLGDWDSEPYNSGGPLAVPVLGYWDSDDQMDIGVFRTDKKKLYIKYASQGFDGDWHDRFQYSINLGSSYDIFVLHRRNERSLFVIKTNADRYFHIDDAVIP